MRESRKYRTILAFLLEFLSDSGCLLRRENSEKEERYRDKPQDIWNCLALLKSLGTQMVVWEPSLVLVLLLTYLRNFLNFCFLIWTTEPLLLGSVYLTRRATSFSNPFSLGQVRNTCAYDFAKVSGFSLKLGSRINAIMKWIHITINSKSYFILMNISIFYIDEKAILYWSLITCHIVCWIFNVPYSF